MKRFLISAIILIHMCAAMSFCAFAVSSSAEIDGTAVAENAELYSASQADVLIWDFDNNTRQDWGTANGVDKGVKDGIYKVVLSTSTSDTWIQNTSVNFEASAYKYMIFYMRHNLPDGDYGPDNIYGLFVRTQDTPWQAHLLTRISTRYTASQGFMPYIIDMTKCSYWNGTIKALRIDPFEKKSTSDTEYYFEIDKILISYDVTLTLDDKQYTVPAGVAVKLSDYDAPEKSGFIFTGWTNGETDEIITEITPLGDVTLTSSWSEGNPEWNFDDNTTQGWTSSVNGTISAENGAMKVLMHNTNSDVYVYISDLDIDTSKYKYGVAYMRHNVPDSAAGSTPYFQMLFYNTNASWWAEMMVNESRKPASTEYNRYIFNLGSNKYWAGTIKRLRFDAFDATTSNTGDYYHEIDKIMLCPEVSLTFDFGYDEKADETVKIPGGIEMSLSELVTVPERDGYRFLGWTNRKGDIVTSVDILSAATLTASWKATTPSITLTDSKVKVENLETDAVLVLSGFDTDGRLVDTVMKDISSDTEIKLLESGLDVLGSKTVKAFLFNSRKSLYPLCREKTTVLYTLDYKELENEQYGFVGRWFDYEHSDGNTYKATITPGSEIYFKVSGTTTVNLKLNCNAHLYDEPFVAVSVDGKVPERVRMQRTNPKAIATGLDANKEHVIRIIVDSFESSQSDRWTKGNGLIFDKITVDAGGTITGLIPENPIIAYYGDSITEGLGSLSTQNSGIVPYSSSAISAYPFTASHLLGAVSHTNGYGSTGLTVAGLGKIPKFMTVIDYVIDGVPIVMPELDAIVINHGHNDLNSSVSGPVFQEEYIKALERLREKHPHTPIFAVVPYAQRYVNEIKNAVDVMNDQNIHYISTAGWEYTTLDGVHPDADGAVKLGTKLAEAIGKILKFN